MALAAETTAHDVQDLLEATRERVREYLERTKESQSSLARSIGISPARFSQVLAGTYAGNVEESLRLINYGLDKLQAQMAAPEPPPYAETQAAREVLAVCQYAHENRTIGIIHGDAGLGKTMSIRKYQSEHPDTVIVTADPTLTSMKAILEELAAACGVKLMGSARRLRKAISAALRGTGKLIVIDEAQHLSAKAIDTLRAIHDDSAVGMVFAGSDDFFAQLRGRSQSDFAQFYSRVGIRRRLQPHVSAEDVRQIFAGYGLSEESLRLLHEAANQGQGLRGMVKTWVFAANFARSQGVPVGPDHILGATAYLTA